MLNLLVKDRLLFIQGFIVEVVIVMVDIFRLHPVRVDWNIMKMEIIFQMRNARDQFLAD